ncbi:hypothetical protein AYO21_08626 [Fonsecaea monophora]|uniref:DUF7924 domain-containing protein n=1 Tax=Fonsecaea monophora TaxID=254056 RepID=A0A177EZ09_9EURO|nr:hypothetical protein AYO21_08626 [Fonsecaea monophora]KAH0836171.1 hypothetical protein FOPE_04237 [Fonsecaea pedrosoi]OAG37208.1 hypothetical protein AYO21_08626 [Fonsecaea monophora]
MAAGVAKRDTGAARSGHNRPDQQPVAPGRSNRKRHLSAKEEEKDTAEYRRKSRRIEESSNQRPRNAPKEGPKPPRKSPRLQERRPSNSQRTARGGKQETNLPHPQSEEVKPHQYRKEEGEGLSTVSTPQLGVHKSTKRRRCENNGDESNHQAKRPRRRPAQYAEARSKPPDKEESIENWLEGSSWSRRASTEHQTHLPETVIKMPRKAAGTILPSPDNSCESTTSSRRSEKSTASVHDTEYRQSLRYRNIYIERENPPPELMRRAQRIISRSRVSPEIDDATIEELKRTSRRLQDDAEDKIIKQLVPDIIPAMKRIPDQRLEMNADQLWCNAVPVPLNANVPTTPLPLPKPKPDLAFGYSQAAFTEKQLMTIDLLVDDQFGRSYATPDQKVRFPFLEIEFKSQAKNGTHYIATNQAAGAGAIALNGNMDLTQRSFGMDKFDYEEPQYFSVTMDHQLACINVHWLGAPAEGGQHSFHVEGLSQHLLRDENGIRAVSRAIKNILDWGADPRLRALCAALDAYRETVVRNREAANAQRRQGHDNPLTPQIVQQTKGTVLPLDPGVERVASCQYDRLQIERQPQREQITPRYGRVDIPASAPPEISRHPTIAPTTHPYEDAVISRQPIPGTHLGQSAGETGHLLEYGKSRRQIKPTQKVLDNASANGGRLRRR